MMGVLFALSSLIFLCSTAAVASEPLTCNSPCECHNAHRKGRWSVKTDPSLPPTDGSLIHAVTPSDMTWRLFL